MCTCTVALLLKAPSAAAPKLELVSPNVAEALEDQLHQPYRSSLMLVRLEPHVRHEPRNGAAVEKDWALLLEDKVG